MLNLVVKCTRLAAVVCSPMVLCGVAAAQCCGYVQPMCQTVFMPEQVTRYRIEYETVMKPEQVTTYRPVWETSTRERRYTVARPVTETTYRDEQYTVLRPVMTTEEREQVYNVTEYVNETQTRQVQQTVMKPVWVQQVHRQQYTVRRPVQKTVMQNQQSVQYQQVTNYVTKYVDQGQYVCQQQVTPGPERNRLRWLAGQQVVDPVTGTTRWQRGGLYWVPTPTAARVQTARVWQPNVVAQQVPVVQNVAQVVNQQVPVQVTEYVDEVQTREIAYNVCQWQQEVQVQNIPYTVARPVTRQVVNKYQVQVCNWERQEMVRRVPVTTCRMEYEERVEQIPVRTCKWVEETSTVMRPHCVAKCVPYTCTRLVPRTVMMGSPCGGCGTVAAVAAPAVSVPGQATPIPSLRPGPAGQSPTTSLKPVTPSVGQEQSADATGERKQNSVLRSTPDLNPPAPADGREPAEQRPALPPTYGEADLEV